MWSLLYRKEENLFNGKLYIILADGTLLWQTVHYSDKLYIIPINQGGSRGGPPKIGKNMIFWRKIVIFHTK